MNASLSHLSPDDLARQYGVSGIRIRTFLRQRYPEQAPGSGGRWVLTEDQAGAVGAYFGQPRPTRTANREGPSTLGAAATDDWFWEGNVQETLVKHLGMEGWTIISQADAGQRERGFDVVADRAGRRLIVEVKGYPSKNYRDPRRSAEIKPTNPTLQAKHWFSDALLKAIRTRVAHTDADVAMCFPIAPRYASLLSETRPMLEAMKITVFMVSELGEVAGGPPTVAPRRTERPK